MSDSTWMSAEPHLASSLSPSQDERMRSPQNLHGHEDGECPQHWQGGRGSGQQTDIPRLSGVASLLGGGSGQTHSHPPLSPETQQGLSVSPGGCGGGALHPVLVGYEGVGEPSL